MTAIDIKNASVRNWVGLDNRDTNLRNQASLVLLLKDLGIWERDTGEKAQTDMVTDMVDYVRGLALLVTAEAGAVDLAF